jgi:hypothetical protein
MSGALRELGGINAYVDWLAKRTAKPHACCPKRTLGAGMILSKKPATLQDHATKGLSINKSVNSHFRDDFAVRRTPRLRFQCDKARRLCSLRTGAISR